MFLKNSTAALVGLGLGIVWFLIGFIYNNSGIMMLGGLMLCFGLFFKLKKEPVKNVSDGQSIRSKKQTVLK